MRRDEAVSPEALFDQIPVRQTNRSVYDGRIIPPDTVELLEGLFAGSAVKARFYRNGTPEFGRLAEFVIAGNASQMADRAFTGELKSWMRFNRGHQEATRDGLSYAVFGAPNLPRFIAEAAISIALNARLQNRGDSRKIASSSHFVLLTAPADTPGEWVRLGMVMQRFLLRSTELGIAHAHMNQPVEVAELSARMTETLNISGEHPMILLRAGYGARMPYSKRLKVEEVIFRE